MADEHATERKEGLVDVGSPLVAHAQAAKAVEPGERAFHDPAMAAELLRTVLPATSDAWRDPTLAQGCPAARVVVALVGVQLLGPVAWTTSMSSDGRDGIESYLQHLGVMHVGGRKYGGQGQPATLYHKVVLRARAAASDRTRAGFLAPFGAGTEHESKQARLQSSRAASAKRCKSTWCRAAHTPASCQSRSRRQHVMPEPQPISGGNNSQGVPVRSTKTRPVSTARSEMRSLPPRGRGGTGGSNHSTSFHNASLTSGLAMRQTYQKTRFC